MGGLTGGIQMAEMARAPSALATATRMSNAARTKAPTRSAVWGLEPLDRGFAIEGLLGTNLAKNLPVIDRFINGIATSIKSIDLTLKSYQSISTLKRTLLQYVHALVDFGGTKWGDDIVRGSQITGRSLEIVIPAGTATAEQQAAIQVVANFAKLLGVVVKIVEL
jgi:filamentous hemagglutinin